MPPATQATHEAVCRGVLCGSHGREKCFATMKSKMNAVRSTLGTVGEASPTAVLVTSVAASWAAKSSELKCAAPDLDGLRWHQRSLEDLFRPVPGQHDKVPHLEDVRDGWVRCLPLEGTSIIAMRVQERHAHTSHAETIGDANLRVQREARFQSRYP